jgi:hypothetical protein
MRVTPCHRQYLLLLSLLICLLAVLIAAASSKPTTSRPLSESVKAGSQQQKQATQTPQGHSGGNAQAEDKSRVQAEQRHKDTEHKDTEHKDTEHKDKDISEWVSHREDLQGEEGYVMAADPDLPPSPRLVHLVLNRVRRLNGLPPLPDPDPDPEPNPEPSTPSTPSTSSPPSTSSTPSSTASTSPSPTPAPLRQSAPAQPIAATPTPTPTSTPTAPTSTEQEYDFDRALADNVEQIDLRTESYTRRFFEEQSTSAVVDLDQEAPAVQPTDQQHQNDQDDKAIALAKEIELEAQQEQEARNRFHNLDISIIQCSNCQARISTQFCSSCNALLCKVY